MTILSWSLELIDGGLVVFLWFNKDLKGYKVPLFLFCHISISSVLIPSSYILKTDTVKKLITANGWLKPFEDFVPFRRNRIAPVEEINMDVIPHIQTVNKDILDPIPTDFLFREFPDISIFA